GRIACRLGRFPLPLCFLALPLFMTTVKPQERSAPAPRLINQPADPLLASFRFRSIGPASMGGRVDDIAVSESEPNINLSATPWAGSSNRGFDISWDQGRTWDFVNTMATALAYVVTADMRRPYFVYTGLQDNGSWGGPSAVRGRGGIMNSDWYGIGGGDGFYTAVDPTDHNIVITESQDGNTNRYD